MSDAGQIAQRRAAWEAEPSVLLSNQPATPAQYRFALLVSSMMLAAFVATLPFATIGLTPFPGMILVQNSLLLTNDLITASLLFSQYRFGRSRTLLILAAAYLFTGMMAASHAMTFPGLLPEPVLLHGGPQSTPWIYVAWHSVLPLAVILHALRRSGAATGGRVAAGRIPILIAIFAAVGGAAAITSLLTAGYIQLPVLVDQGRLQPLSKLIVPLLLLPPFVALLLLAKRPSRSVLDLWLMVVMLAWLCTISLVSFISIQRFDTGWYMGRVFEVLTSVFVLLMLLSEIFDLYARNVHASAIERIARERRLKETEAVLAHLARVSELGQIVSGLSHEVNQPLSAVCNYVEAGIVIATKTEADSLQQILRNTLQQANRATEIIRHLRDLVARREPKKEPVYLPEVLRSAVRLALVGADADAPDIALRCAPEAAWALGDRIQIEQVVFNLVRNAVEAMAGGTRRTLTVSTRLAAGDTVEVRIADTGPGLLPEVRERLFEPFVTSKADGLGIGLPVCRFIVEAHGGELRADDNLGGGTVFRFTLPRTAEPLRSDPPLSELSAP
jgi:signal transduction histidine kinase